MKAPLSSFYFCCDDDGACCVVMIRLRTDISVRRQLMLMMRICDARKQRVSAVTLKLIMVVIINCL